jgi:hypothetical protein
MRQFIIGDRVALSVQFLKSIGETPTGEMCRWRGVVQEENILGKLRILKVLWDHDPEYALVNEANLALVGPNSRFANCE